LRPVPPPGAVGCFRRMPGLTENDWPGASVAVVRRPGAGGDTLQVGLSALAPAPRHLEVQVGGLGLAQAQELVDEAAAGLIDPVGDLGGSPAYKRRLGRLRVGPALQDQPLLAAEKVVFAGEPIAAVVAETREAARRAADRVWAEYEELEPVLDLERAAARGPFVHDQLRPAGTFADLKRLAGV